MSSTVPVAPPRGLSIASLVLGIISLIAGFVFLVPLIGLILGIVGVRKEPAGKGFAIGGIVLNALALLSWLLVVLLLFSAGVLALIFSAGS